MKLKDVALDLRHSLGVQYIIKENTPLVLEEDPNRLLQQVQVIERETQDVVAIFSGEPKEFNITLTKDLDKKVRRKVFGWYINLHKSKDNKVDINIQKQVHTKQYETYNRELNDYTILAEYTEGMLDYVLYVQTPLANLLDVIEIIRQINYDLLNEDYH